MTRNHKALEVAGERIRIEMGGIGDAAAGGIVVVGGGGGIEVLGNQIKMN